MVPEQQFSHIDLVRHVTVGHFKGEVIWQEGLSYEVNKEGNIDMSQGEGEGGAAH